MKAPARLVMDALVQVALLAFAGYLALSEDAPPGASLAPRGAPWPGRAAGAALAPRPGCGPRGDPGTLGSHGLACPRPLRPAGRLGAGPRRPRARGRGVRPDPRHALALPPRDGGARREVRGEAAAPGA